MAFGVDPSHAPPRRPEGIAARAARRPVPSARPVRARPAAAPAIPPPTPPRPHPPDTDPNLSPAAFATPQSPQTGAPQRLFNNALKPTGRAQLPSTVIPSGDTARRHPGASQRPAGGLALIR